MSATPLLHNMSVPPNYTLKVARPHLGGEAFFIGPPVHWRGFDASSPPARKDLELALGKAGVPDRVGVFVEGDVPGHAKRLPGRAAAAVLARRSGPLYLPWRAVDPLLVKPAAFLLVFPAEGDLP